jgi:hypothetical protein
MFKTLAAISAALVCMTGDITVQKASANGNWDYCQSYHGGLRVCAIAGDSNDTVAIADPKRGYVRFGVACKLLPQNQYSWNWEVFEASENNNFSKQGVDDFANEFCQGRLGVEAASTGPKYTMA